MSSGGGAASSGGLAVDLGVSEGWSVLKAVDTIRPRPARGILRMRAGGDALKADLRVTRGLRLLGFHVPGGVHATLVIARAVAEEIGTSLLVLDQLLWWWTTEMVLNKILASSPRVCLASESGIDQPPPLGKKNGMCGNGVCETLGQRLHGESGRQAFGEFQATDCCEVDLGQG
jgi:hypothetical protein